MWFRGKSLVISCVRNFCGGDAPESLVSVGLKRTTCLNFATRRGFTDCGSSFHDCQKFLLTDESIGSDIWITDCAILSTGNPARGHVQVHFSW